MKKLLYLILCSILLVGCSSKNTSEQKNDSIVANSTNLEQTVYEDYNLKDSATVIKNIPKDIEIIERAIYCPLPAGHNFQYNVEEGSVNLYNHLVYTFKNNSNKPIITNYKADYVDKKGTVLDTFTFDSVLLYPGQETTSWSYGPLSDLAKENYKDLHHIVISEYQPSNLSCNTIVDNVNFTANIIEDGDYSRLNATITNNSKFPIAQSNIIGILKDNSGKTINVVMHKFVNFNEVGSNWIAPGETKTLSETEYVNVGNYEFYGTFISDDYYSKKYCNINNIEFQKELADNAEYIERLDENISKGLTTHEALNTVIMPPYEDVPEENDKFYGEEGAIIYEVVKNFTIEKLKETATDLSNGTNNTAQSLFRTIGLGVTTIGEYVDSFEGCIASDYNIDNIMIPPYHKVSIGSPFSVPYINLDYSLPKAEVYGYNNSAVSIPARDIIITGTTSDDIGKLWGCVNNHIDVDMTGLNEYLTTLEQYELNSSDCLLNVDDLSLDLVNITNSQLWLNRDTDGVYEDENRLNYPSIILPDLLTIKDNDKLLAGGITETEGRMEVVINGGIHITATMSAYDLYNFYDSVIDCAYLDRDGAFYSGSVTIDEFKINHNPQELLEKYKKLYPEEELDIDENEVDLSFEFDKFSLDFDNVELDKESFQDEIIFRNNFY